MTFNVSDRVVLIKDSNLDSWNTEEDETVRGVVEALTSDNRFVVKWDWNGLRDSIYNAAELMLESEANQILSKLEAEYNVWSSPIAEKVEAAAQLLKEAGELASEQDRSIIELHDLVRPLLGAMRSLGWSTSSLNC